MERSRLGDLALSGTDSAFGSRRGIAPQITRYKTRPISFKRSDDRPSCSLSSATPYLFCFFNCEEQVAHESKPVTIKETVDTVRQNRPLLILCVSIWFSHRGLRTQASQAYYAAYILGNSTQLIWMAVATSLSTFVAVPIVPRFVARIGKKKTFLIGALGLIVMGTWIFFMPPAC